MQGFHGFPLEPERGLPTGKSAVLPRIVMKTIILPSGNAFGVDDIDGVTA